MVSITSTPCYRSDPPQVINQFNRMVPIWSTSWHRSARPPSQWILRQQKPLQYCTRSWIPRVTLFSKASCVPWYVILALVSDNRFLLNALRVDLSRQVHSRRCMICMICMIYRSSRCRVGPVKTARFETCLLGRICTMHILLNNLLQRSVDDLQQ